MMQFLSQYAHHQLGLRLSRSQLSALALYERELVDWNNHFNLTAIRDPQEIHTKHFLDSLTCLLAMRESPIGRLVDIGTGAGFPGIPLKIMLPNTHLTLVESVGKKAEFCRHVVKILDLPGVEVVQQRAEVLGQDPQYRERYDWAVARAVAILPVLAEYLLPLVRVGGRMLAMKGESGPAEAHTAEHGMLVLGGHLRQLLPVNLPGVAEERYLIVIDKVAATPGIYPRKVGVPVKRPL
jgi:16S rRNA (guanine527-N7)-methyltransferase